MEEETTLITPGGYNYIIKEEIVDLGNGLTGTTELKIRNSLVGRRLEEDDELFEEYKIRQKMARFFIKSTKKGKVFWPSKRILVDADLKAIKDKDIDVLNDHRKLNLGTYNKEKLEKLITNTLQNEVDSNLPK